MIDHLVALEDLVSLGMGSSGSIAGSCGQASLHQPLADDDRVNAGPAGQGLDACSDISERSAGPEREIQNHVQRHA